MKKIFIIILGLAGILVVYVASAKKSFRYPIVVNSINNIILSVNKEAENNKSSTKTFQANERKWQLIDDKFWQIVADGTVPHSVVDEQEGNRGVCPEGMIEIRGQMKLDPPNMTLDDLQKQACTKWVNRDFPDRCAEYSRDQWLQLSKNLKTRYVHFCIDRFEGMALKGGYPIIFINYYEAEELCKRQGKRLPTELEWEFAASGEEALPYPYGYSRDGSKEHGCNIDKMWRPYHESKLIHRNLLDTMEELDLLWQGEPAGSRIGCKSPFGLYDTTGSVDEITTAVRPISKYKLALKGGYWSRVRTRNFATTRSHNENFIFYQESFRCLISLD